MDREFSTTSRGSATDDDKEILAVTIVAAAGDPSLARDILGSGVPALVAVAVVLISGWQQKHRQRDEFRILGRNMAVQHSLEHRQYLRTERRVMYAQFLRSSDQLLEATTTLLSANESDTTEWSDSFEVWKGAYSHLMLTSQDLQLICSGKMLGPVSELVGFWGNQGEALEIDPRHVLDVWRDNVRLGDDTDIDLLTEVAALRVDVVRAARADIEVPDFAEDFDDTRH